MSTDRSKGSVRMGPVSIFSLVIILCLAVLSVLAITTAQASHTLASKQELFNNDTYVNEVAAQEFLVLVDNSLSASRAQGIAHEQALASLTKVLPEGGVITSSTLHVVFSTDSGRQLSIELDITPDNYYRVSRWSATTKWEIQDSGATLWTGKSNQ